MEDVIARLRRRFGRIGARGWFEAAGFERIEIGEGSNGVAGRGVRAAG